MGTIHVGTTLDVRYRLHMSTTVSRSFVSLHLRVDPRLDLQVDVIAEHDTHQKGRKVSKNEIHRNALTQYVRERMAADPDLAATARVRSATRERESNGADGTPSRPHVLVAALG